MNRKTDSERIPERNPAIPESHGVYYTPQELADLWKCNISTVYAMLRQGKLSGFKLGRDWRITEAAVLAYEQNPENQSAMIYQKPDIDRRRSKLTAPQIMRVV